MTIRRFFAATLLAAMVSAAFAQSPVDDDPQTRITLNKVGLTSGACVDLVRLADKDSGVACVVSGVITPAGKIDDPVARCEKTSFEGPARRCFGRFTLKKQHAGQTGPVCAAFLFVPIGRKGKPEAVDISLREYTPCKSLAQN
jgi:hypothetical protein